MPSRPSFFNSSVGSKYLIAFTGLSLVGFLIGHLAGNLLVYVSPESFNHYGDKLIKNPLLMPRRTGAGRVVPAARLQSRASLPRLEAGAAGRLREEGRIGSGTLTETLAR